MRAKAVRYLLANLRHVLCTKIPSRVKIAGRMQDNAKGQSHVGCNDEPDLATKR